jgi:site-specific recombinase XerD
MVSLKAYIDEYLHSLEGRRLSVKTIKRSRYLLNRFLKVIGNLDIREIDRRTIEKYILYLKNYTSQRKRPLSERSIILEVITLRGFFSYLFSQEVILLDPMENIPLKKQGEYGKRTIFSREDIQELLEEIPAKTPAGQRDRAFFELMYSSGLRGGELLDLKKGDLQLQERMIYIRNGKGGKSRTVPFSEVAALFLTRYLTEGREKLLKFIRGKKGREYMFLSPNGRCSHSMMRQRFVNYLELCALEEKNYTMHSIRHATATHLLEEGAGVRYVQELLGHESLATTQIYTRPSEERTKSIYRTYHPGENEYYVEVEKEYLKELQKLKKEIISGLELHLKKKGRKNLPVKKETG